MTENYRWGTPALTIRRGRIGLSIDPHIGDVDAIRAAFRTIEMPVIMSSSGDAHDLAVAARLRDLDPIVIASQNAVDGAGPLASPLRVTSDLESLTDLFELIGVSVARRDDGGLSIATISEDLGINRAYAREHATPLLAAAGFRVGREDLASLEWTGPEGRSAMVTMTSEAWFVTGDGRTAQPVMGTHHDLIAWSAERLGPDPHLTEGTWMGIEIESGVRDWVGTLGLAGRSVSLHTTSRGPINCRYRGHTHDEIVVAPWLPSGASDESGRVAIPLSDVRRIGRTIL